jgi:hypothetical protein
MIRNIPFSQNPFNTSFEEAFEEYYNKYPIALSIENNGGKQRIRIEKYDDIFETDVIHEFGRDVSGLERTIREDRIYTGVKCGEKDHEYEEVTGLNTTQGQMNLTTPIQAKDTTYVIVGKWRTDPEGLELARRIQYADNATTDTRYDKDIWLIDAYKPAGTIVARRTELFQLVEGILNPNNVYNLRLSPKRCILRHGGILNESLSRNTGSILYTKGASNQELITQLLTEDNPVVEKDDIDLTDLSLPKLFAEIINVSAPVDTELYNLLVANKNKILNFTDINGKKIGCYLKEFPYEHPNGEADFTLIRANR